MKLSEISPIFKTSDTLETGNYPPTNGHVAKYLLIFENNFMGRYFQRLIQDSYVPKSSLIDIMV